MRTEVERYFFLDWLRVIAIFVLLFFHTGMLFVGWWWHIRNPETIDGLKLPMDIAHRLRMPLLFMIAGASMWFSLKRRSAARFAGERSVRLLLPLVAGMFLIVPPQIYFERLSLGQWQGGYGEFLIERVFQFVPYPAGDFAWHHLWFIVYLYVYALLLLPALLWCKKRELSVRPGIWLYVLAIPLGVNEAVLRPWFPESHTLISDWYIFNHYLLLTVYGFLMASIPGCWDWLASHRRPILIVAVAVFATVLPLYETGVIPRGTALDSVIANIFTWTTLLAFLAWGCRLLSFENPLLRWAREASYPIYILHQTIIIAIGYFVIQLAWSPGVKYWVVLLGTIAGCVILYELIVRRFTLTRLLFGMKAIRKRDRPVTNSGFVTQYVDSERHRSFHR